MPLRRIQEVAERLSVTVPRAYELIRTGLIPGVRIGRQVRVDDAALCAFIASGGRGLGGSACKGSASTTAADKRNA